MLAGAVVGQAASVLLSPVLTRIYDPAEIGTLSVFIAIISVLSVLGTLRYEMTLPIATSEGDTVNLAALGLSALVVTTSLVAAAAYLVPVSWLAACRLGPLIPFRLLFPVAFALMAGYQLVLYLATRDGAFRAIARSRVGQGFAAPVIQIMLGLLGGGSPGLALGFMAGQSAGTSRLIQHAWRTHRAAFGLVSVGRMRRLARRYWRFPAIASWSALLDAAGGSQLLYVLVCFCYSAHIAGFVFLAERVLARPLTILGTSLLQVFVGEAGQAASSDPGLLRRRFWQVTGRQGLVALVWLACANAVAAFLLPTLFGAAWAGALPFLEGLSLAYLAQALIEPVFHTLQILERQALAAIWQATRLVLVLAGFFAASHLGATATQAILLYAVIQAACSLLLFGLMARAVEGIQPTAVPALV